MSNINISPEGKVKVYWNDRPENYSRANRNNIRNKFAKKYNIDKERVKVVYRPMKLDTKGNLIKLDGMRIENIGDVNYQRQLFKEWLTRGNHNVDFDRLMKLDDQINSELEIDLTHANNRKWEFEWIKVDNFLAFGDDNYFPINKFNGLVTVTSVPQNTGGKTTMIIDAFKFLLYGITSRTSKNEEVFNRYREKDTLEVRGLMCIDGYDNFVIERKMSRREKKQGGWMVTNVVNYYKILPDGEEEKMNEEDSVQTTKLIQETVGTPKDFDLVSLATGKNLDSLIDFTTTENGKIFTKFIGLEIMEMKEELARTKYNAYTKAMKANTYNIVDLQEEVENAKTHLEMSEGLLVTATNNKEELVAKISELEAQKISLINSKEKIDDKLALSNPTKLDLDIDEYTKAGVKTKDTLTEVLASIEALKSVTYDEYREKRLSDDVVKLTTSIAVKKNEIQTHNRDILNLKNSEVCHSCHRPLEGVDHTAKIKELVDLIADTEDSIADMEAQKTAYSLEIASFAEVKESLNRKQRLELERDRLNVKLDELRNKVKESKNLKAEYEANLKAIEFNKKVDSSVSLTTANIQVARHEHDELIKKIENIKNEINRLKEKIDFNTKMISAIEKELTVEKMYKLYVDMVGKKGVSKIVLRSVLPIINSELERLLEGVCDFDVEVRMDDKNEVHLIMIKDGVEGPLKSTSGFERTVSSVALRCVLGVVSTLPMPNFIAFDEVLDKVAPDFIPNMKPLFDKIKDMYDKVFIITHDELARDWSDKMITITKKDNVSVINYSH
jgi:hypothetical protein